MRWQLRFIRNALIGVLPLGVQRLARQVKRRFFPHRLEVDLWTLEQGLRQVEMLRAAGADPAGKRCVEIGTGWSPVIPLVFHFAGAKSITLVDIQRLMDDHTFRETCRQLVPQASVVAQRLKIEPERVRTTLTRLAGMSLEDGFAAIQCRYLAPFNLLDGRLATEAFDVITSRAVLEHIPPAVLKAMFEACARLLDDRGVMCHLIDNSDHWEHSDKGISRVNFLKFRRGTFALISAMNPLDYQNRLRHSEYLRLMGDAGFDIVRDTSVPDVQALSDIGRMRIAPMFRSFADYDLAILSTNVVARKRARANSDAVAGEREVGAAGRVAKGAR